jgi:hypothetical protein
MTVVKEISRKMQLVVRRVNVCVKGNRELAVKFCVWEKRKTKLSKKGKELFF